MRQCIGIIAHKAEPQLKWLVQDLLDQGFEVLIHADQSSRQNIEQNLGDLSKHVIPNSIKVSRAHISIVDASLALLKESLTKDYDYFHLISGQDLLIKSKAELEEILGLNEDANFINYNAIPVKQTQQEEDIFKAYEIRKDQIEISNYQHTSFQDGAALHQVYQFPTNKVVQGSHKVFGKFRSYWKVYNGIFKKKEINLKMYIGSAWFSIRRELAQYFVSETEQNPELLHYLKHANFPDEMYFQTMALNSAYKDSIVNSDLRYIDWSKPHNDGPKLLGKDDLAQIVMSNGIFARKWVIADEQELKTIKSYRHVNT